MVKTTSELLQQLLTLHEEEEIAFGEIVKHFHETGFAVLLIIFAAPMALPLPALGIAQIMALPLLILSGQLMVGRQSPWVPKWLAKKKIQRQTMKTIVEGLIPYLQKVEIVLKPRIHFLSSRVGEQLVGLLCFICSISVAMPFPFSNTVPSMGIVIMSVGLLERDGIIITAGSMVGAVGITLALLVVFLGVEGVKALL